MELQSGFERVALPGERAIVGSSKKRGRGKNCSSVGNPKPQLNNLRQAAFSKIETRVSVKRKKKKQYDVSLSRVGSEK